MRSGRKEQAWRVKDLSSGTPFTQLHRGGNKGPETEVAQLEAACERRSTCSLSPSPGENPARLTVRISDGTPNQAQSFQSASLVYQPHTSKSSPVPLNLSF